MPHPCGLCSTLRTYRCRNAHTCLFFLAYGVYGTRIRYECGNLFSRLLWCFPALRRLQWLTYAFAEGECMYTKQICAAWCVLLLFTFGSPSFGMSNVKATSGIYGSIGIFPPCLSSSVDYLHYELPNLPHPFVSHNGYHRESLYH